MSARDDPMVRTTSTNVMSIHIVQHSLVPTSHRCCHFPVVVLLHGWLGKESDMSPLAELLSAEGYRVLVPDIPFHGKSQDCRPRTLTGAAHCLTSALSDFLGAAPEQPHPVAIVGYSLGGRLALEFASALTDEPSPNFEVQALVLISSAPPPESELECRTRAEAGQRLAARIREVSPTKEALKTWLMDSWYNSPMWSRLEDASGYEQMIASRLEGFDAVQRDVWAEAAINMARYAWPRTSPPRKIPVLYIHGEHDKKYSSICSQMSSLFARMSIASVEGAGHNVLLQRPAVGLPLVKSFIIQGHPSTPCDKTVLIDSVKAMRYRLLLQKPIVVNGQKVSHREGILLAVSSSSIGASGVGDICPLPGLHTEDARMCMAELLRFAENLHAQKIALFRRCCILEQVEVLTKGASRVSRNGITSALLHLLSQAEKSEYASFLRHLYVLNGGILLRSQRENVYVNGVLPRMSLDQPGTKPCSSLEDRFVQFIERSPFEVLKLKVGTIGDAGLEGEIIYAAAKGAMQLNRDLRLDANKAWTAQQVRAFQRGIGDLTSRIEFIEEPFCKLSELQRYLAVPTEQSSLFVALDESLSECHLSQVASMATSILCRALIVKPAVMGSLGHTLKLTDIAAKTNCKIVVSTIFDSGVGIAWGTLLAALCETQVTCHGLGTYEYLAQDVLYPGFIDCCVVRKTCISIKKCEEFLDRAARRVVAEGEEYLFDSEQ